MTTTSLIDAVKRAMAAHEYGLEDLSWKHGDAAIEFAARIEAEGFTRPFAAELAAKTYAVLAVH